MEENHQIVACASRRAAEFYGKFCACVANSLFKSESFPYPVSEDPAKCNNTMEDDPFLYRVVDILVIFLHFSPTLCRIIPDIAPADEPSVQPGADMARHATTVLHVRQSS